IRYNRVAMSVLRDYPEVIVNDLYSFTLPHQKEWWTKPGNVHYNETGYTAQGKEVAGVIREALKK
ncbi:MAG: SGNH/GDSL hydrolase family protein, partial [Verrucomicrobiae bacterium]|nr:SGNH/GDSL hydrolase family protein [Verrucomicrobiae bacterium]